MSKLSLETSRNLPDVFAKLGFVVCVYVCCIYTDIHIYIFSIYIFILYNAKCII